jgi:hypothetical protein
MKSINLKRLNQIAGAIVILFNLFWIWENLRLLYSYHNANTLFYIMYPDWMLVLNAIFGLIGIFIGFFMIRGRIKLKTGIIINILFLLVSVLLKQIITM